MAFGTGNNASPMVGMNVTPLVDVMLVLLIIFMVTMPPMTYAVKVDLPVPSPIPPTPVTAPPIDLTIDRDGNVTFHGSAVDVKGMGLENVMQVEAERYADVKDQPVIRINADADAQYHVLAKVLAAAKNSGLVKIGFVDNGQR